MNHPVHMAVWWPEPDTRDIAALDPFCEFCGHPIGAGQSPVEDEEGLWHRPCWSEVHESKPQDYGMSAADVAAEYVEAGL